MNLNEIGQKYWTDKVEHTFLPFYEKYIENKDIKSVLEIGIYQGASIKMWREYFPNAEITWIDLFPKDSIEWCTVLRWDASNKDFLDTLWTFDLIIDDWSHLMSHQKKTFEILWEHLNEWGFYIVEDLHTSFMEEYIDEQPKAYEYFTNIDIKKELYNWNWGSSKTIILFK